MSSNVPFFYCNAVASIFLENGCIVTLILEVCHAMFAVIFFFFNGCSMRTLRLEVSCVFDEVTIEAKPFMIVMKDEWYQLTQGFRSASSGNDWCPDRFISTYYMSSCRFKCSDIICVIPQHSFCEMSWKKKKFAGLILTHVVVCDVSHKYFNRTDHFYTVSRKKKTPYLYRIPASYKQSYITFFINESSTIILIYT